MTFPELLTRLPAVRYSVGPDGRLRELSGAVEALLGLPADVLIDDPERWRGCRPESVLGPLRRPDGETVWLLRHETRDEDGLEGLLVDATPMRSYFDAAGTVLVVLDTDGRVSLLNRAGAELLGYDDGELDGCPWFDQVVPPESRGATLERFARLLDGDDSAAATTADQVLRTKDGGTRVLTWRTAALRDDTGRVVGTVSHGLDVTDAREAEAQVAHLAYHDPLTGLPNRALLQEHLALALARARRNGTAVALLYLDLDDFKLVNDSLGHAAGDRLIEKVANRLRARRRSADLLARHGGDEFLLLLGDLDPDEAEPVALQTANAMVAHLQTPFVVAGAEFHIGASVGVSVFPRDAQDDETLLRHADAAMYQAKRAGRDEVRVFDGDRSEPLRRLSMTSRLRAAIAEDELVLHWQPIVDPATNRLESLEALVRWQDPLRGLLLPGEFVPFAEETGLIRRMGGHVLHLICRQRKKWQAEGFDPRVTMNVSPRQLEPGFPAFVREIHEEYGLSPDRLMIEITESAAMQDAARVEPILLELARTGARLAIDDFGAGYSSLSRLRRLPVAMLKIDRQFLADAPDEPAATAIVTAVVELSEALGMQTVAEGVEGEDQRAFLVGLKCPLAQGYLLGRPVPAGELRDLLASQPVTAAS